MLAIIFVSVEFLEMCIGINSLHVDLSNGFRNIETHLHTSAQAPFITHSHLHTCTHTLNTTWGLPDTTAEKYMENTVDTHLKGIVHRILLFECFKMTTLGLWCLGHFWTVTTIWSLIPTCSGNRVVPSHGQMMLGLWGIQDKWELKHLPLHSSGWGGNNMGTCKKVVLSYFNLLKPPQQVAIQQQ